MRGKSVPAAAVLAVAFVLLAVSAVCAGDPAGTVTGGPSTGGPGLTPEEQILVAQKHKLADDYQLVRSGALDPAVFASEYESVIGTDPPVVEAPTGPLTLSVTQYAQTKFYYCGPATAYEILHYLDVTTGPNGESLTQKHLASKCQAGYLCTEALGETPWYYYSGYAHPMRSTLNKWANTSWYIVNTGSSGYQSALVSDIVYHYPIAMSVREESGGPHLVGHPAGSTINHWIAAHGYDQNGSLSYYADSVHGTSFWSWSPNVPAHSWISSGSLTSMMDAGGYGYIW